MNLLFFREQSLAPDFWTHPGVRLDMKLMNVENESMRRIHEEASLRQIDLNLLVTYSCPAGRRRG